MSNFIIMSLLILELLRWAIDPLFRAGITHDTHPRDTVADLTPDAVRF